MRRLIDSILAAMLSFRTEQLQTWLTDTSQLRDSRDSQLRSVTVV